MSHELIFTILPFDPFAKPVNEIRLPIDVDDLTRQLQVQWPDAEVNVHKNEKGATIRLYISHAMGEGQHLSSFGEDYTILNVRGWPKSIAKEVILWYRQYVSIHFRLYLITPENSFATEITASTTPEDIESMYPYSIPDD